MGQSRRGAAPAAEKWNDNKNPLAALNYYEQAVRLEPEEPRPYHWRGMIYEELGYRDRCKQNLEKALELDPQNPNVHFASAGCLLMGAGDFDRVVELAERGSGLGNPGGYILAVVAEELRRDPRFMAELEAYGAFEVWRELGPPPGCQPSGEIFTCQVQ